MKEETKRTFAVALIVSLIFVGFAAAIIIKTYQMTANMQKATLRLYYDPDLAEAHVITLANFNWTTVYGPVVSGTVLNMWARSEGNIAGNFTFQVQNAINCSVIIAPPNLLNFAPGNNASITLTLGNVTDDCSWQIGVNV